MESRIQAFEILWSNRMQRPPPLARTEEYDDPFELMRSWLVRTTADMVRGGEPAEEINAEAYWEDVFGNNWRKTPEDNTVEQAVEEQAVEQDEMAVYWTEMFGDWGQEEEDWDPLDYDDDAGEVYDMLLLE